MNGAVVWYQSRALLGMIAALILTGLSAFHVLPKDLTQDQIVNFLLVAIPILIAIHGRITATKVIAATPAKAAAVTAAVQAGGPASATILQPGQAAVAAPSTEN